MAPRPRASDARARPGLHRWRPSSGLSTSTGRRGGVAPLALATCLLGAAACRQSVLLDSAVDSGAGASSAGAGASSAGAGGDPRGGATGGTSGAGHFDGGRPDGFPFCFGGQIQYLPISMRSPYVIMSVDRSADMQMSFGTGTGLSVVQQQVQGLMTKYPVIKWGYQEFPSTTSMCGNGQGCCAGDVVPPSYSSGRTIRGAIHACDGGGANCKQAQRPISDALSKCYDAYKQIYNSDQMNDHRYVVLVSSGDPTCTSSPMSTTTPCMDAVAATIKLSNTFTNTAVFAVGDTAIASTCLDMVASFGGLDGHAAKTATDLAVELDTFVESKAEEACKIDVHSPPADPKNAQLLFDGVPIPSSDTEGWSFDPNDQSTNLTLTIHGSYCRSLVQSNVPVHLVGGCMLPHN
ncbi:MAG TPA: hypothetical protein VHL80_01615 [Polyangia bacterium]|nr:hypothetical protein [Polyangia bacterium]